MTAGPITTNVSNSITIRLQLPHDSVIFADVAASIAKEGGKVGAIDIVKAEKDFIVRDLTVDTGGIDHQDDIVKAVQAIDQVKVIYVSDRTFDIHLGGKIGMYNRVPVKSRDQLSMAYTPGVARVCTAIHEDKEKAYKYTIKKNTVAIVSDGTAVLGLGDIGPEAAMPVMEGKAMLFKEFADIDSWPICLDTKDTDEIIQIVKAIAPGFGGINLEDISAPRCFEIERRLKEELDIPVFHDDQHGTAVVLTAALINALRIVKKKPEELKVVVAGVGAAGTACTDMMQQLGIVNVVGCDRKGIVYTGRDGLNSAKEKYASHTNPNMEKGSIKDAMKGADIFVGTSGPGILDVDDLKNMADDAIVFAMSNPTPEIMPELAYPHVAIMATGRSDYPNQVNNVLCFPGLFRGALDCRSTIINDEMKMAAAKAIADCVDEKSLNADYIIPSVFDHSVGEKVAEAVIKAARETGVARH
ncbi:MAG: malate dehydrogenase (oxaloacetate-decarboxylating) [bacterium]|jgi:malate dehydrogenase (oxaloacetate-decarboxylating)